MTKDEVLMMALEALKANDLLINGTEKAGGLAWCIDGYYSDCFDIDPINEQTERTITAIKEALAQPAQEPVALVIDGVLVKSALPEKYTGHLYTTPPQREWVGLTEEERQDIALEVPMDAVLITEAKLKEKNT